MMNKFSMILGLLFCGFILSGCEHQVYEIHMKVDKDRIDRELVCWKTKGGAKDSSSSFLKFPEEEAKQIAKVYHAVLPGALDAKLSFHDFFEKETPPDIGGAGTVHYYDSPVGSVTFYMERFRGEDQLSKTLEKNLQNISLMVKLWDGWLKSLLGKKAGWDRFHVFLVKSLGPDLKNLSLYLWALRIRENAWETASEDYAQEQEDMIMRILLYLFERKYFSMEEWPVFWSCFNKGPDETFYQVLRNCLSRKTELPPHAEVIDSILDLFMKKDLEKSLNDYLQSTEEWKMFLEQNKKNGLPVKGPGEFQSQISEDTFFTSVFSWSGSEKELHVTLKAPLCPLLTNGLWDKKKKQLVWNGEIKETVSLPCFAYATFAEADKKFQKKHFGKILFQEEVLLNYVTWYKALDPLKIREWDVFVESLTPKTYSDKIRNFLFSDETSGTEERAIQLEKSRAKSVREILKELEKN